jgi:lysophospholipase L1-like esterase
MPFTDTEIRMRKYFVGGIVACAGVLAFAGCDSTNIVTPKRTDLTSGLFASYVALGNSISAGYQSGGILDSTQRESFPFLLAQQTGARFAYPSLAAPGCPPPIVNFQTSARLDGGTSTTCAGRQAPSAILNNVAVPGAITADLTAPTTFASNALTTFILGGQTQVAKAIQANPTFVTIEIGNNDWLVAALTGSLGPSGTVGSPGLTPIDSVIAQYARAVNALVAARPTLAGALVGVFPLQAPSALFPAESLYTNPMLQAEFTAAAGGGVTYVPDCIGSQALISIDILPFWAAGAPKVVTCQALPQDSVSRYFILTRAQQDTVENAITTWNAYIKAKADSLGWAYLDPLPLFQQLKMSGQIPPFPNFLSATQPFGPFITLDGIHPSAAAHVMIANGLIGAINAQYKVEIPTITPTM